MHITPQLANKFMLIKAVAHSNLAFVKYWGKEDRKGNIPANSSISMNLSNASTTTSVEQLDSGHDVVVVDGKELSPDTRFASRLVEHVDMIRAIAGTNFRLLIQTRNSFPESVGLASSASGFAALSLACAKIFGLPLDEKNISRIARRGSGSACRSIPSGFVEWHAGTNDEDSFSEQLAPPEYWEIVDLAVTVSSAKKMVSSSRGHELAKTSPFWSARLASLPDRLTLVREAILSKDFETLGREVEKEALEFHAIAQTSPYIENQSWNSGIFYWDQDTLTLMKEVQKFRADGINVYFTLDAGSTVHLLCQPDTVSDLQYSISQLRGSSNWPILLNTPGKGAELIETR